MKTLTKINEAFKNALKAKDKAALSVLRAIKAEVAKFEKESKSDADETKVINLIKKAVKQRNESADLFQKAQRVDLLEVELVEIDILLAFLPKMMDESQMKALVDECIAETGAENIRQMGQVMGLAQKKAAGTADGKVLSTLIKEKLS